MPFRLHRFSRIVVIVPIIAVFAVLVAENEGIVVLAPLAANPIAGLEFTQLNVVFATELVKVIALVLEPAQTTWLLIVLITGIGFTKIVKVCTRPVQPFAEGVAVIVAVPETEVGKELMSPEPLAANPIDGLEFVQL